MISSLKVGQLKVLEKFKFFSIGVKISYVNNITVMSLIIQTKFICGVRNLWNTIFPRKGGVIEQLAEFFENLINNNTVHTNTLYITSYYN